MRQPCVLCDESATEALCLTCQAELPWHRGAQCPVCAWPTPAGTLCGLCARHPPHYRRLRAAMIYQFPLDRMIQAYKYRGELHLGRALAELLLQTVTPEPRPDLLLPVPLHHQRLAERGYNQVVELARLVGRPLGIPTLIDVAQRWRPTLQQTTLTREERVRNVRGAFAVGDAVAGQRVALIDDVVTTGATVDALAQATLQAGAAEVVVWCVGRALPGPHVGAGAAGPHGAGG